MKSDLHWEQRKDQNWRRRLEIYLEQHRIMSGCQVVHMILQDTDWTKRASAYPGGSRARNGGTLNQTVAGVWLSG